jgi:hypothetical protein
MEMVIMVMEIRMQAVMRMIAVEITMEGYIET